MESSEQRARRAYQAYGETTHFRNFQGAPMPAWEDLGKPIQHAWMAAADALAEPEKENAVQLTLGRIVYYRLNKADADAINRRREDFAAREAPGNTGFQAHVGNRVQAGDVFPADIVRVFDPVSGCANLQVKLDGTDTLWATSRRAGGGNGDWFWPPLD